MSLAILNYYTNNDVTKSIDTACYFYRFDSYECKKILFFALLKADLKEKKLKEFATVLENSTINVSIM